MCLLLLSHDLVPTSVLLFFFLQGHLPYGITFLISDAFPRKVISIDTEG